MGTLRLGLWNIDDSTGHTSNNHDTTRHLTLHKVLRNSNSKQVGSVDVDAPQLAHTINWIVNCVKVLSETSRCDETIDLVMDVEDLGDAFGYGIWVRYICVVSCNSRDPKDWLDFI